MSNIVATIYSKDRCSACVTTKRAFESKGIPFVEADLLDEENLAAAKALGHAAAPVVVAGDDHWSGFRIDKINELAQRLKEENN